MLAENTRKQETAKILPFRITAIRIPLADLEKVLDQLQIASFHLNGDWQLNWEDRDEACRAIYDANTYLRERREEVTR